jgi:hypothetical protein
LYYCLKCLWFFLCQHVQQLHYAFLTPLNCLSNALPTYHVTVSLKYLHDKLRKRNVVVVEHADKHKTAIVFISFPCVSLRELCILYALFICASMLIIIIIIIIII